MDEIEAETPVIPQDTQDILKRLERIRQEWYEDGISGWCDKKSLDSYKKFCAILDNLNARPGEKK